MENFLKGIGLSRATQSFDMKKPVMKVGVHDGNHHADDVLAVSLLQTLYPDFDIQVIRSRDVNISLMCDVVLDVGGKYDGIKHFDHHHDPSLKCSVSLLWKAIAEKDYPYEYQYLNKTVLDAVSDMDTDMAKAIQTRGDIDSYYNINALLFLMNGLDGEEGFESALIIGRLFWKAMLKKVSRLQEEHKFIIKGEYVSDETIFIETTLSVNDHKKRFEELGVKYVILPHHQTGRFTLTTVDSIKNPLDRNKMVNPYFFHNACFLAIFNDFDSAVQSATQMTKK